MNTALIIIGLAMLIFIVVFSLKRAKEKMKAKERIKLERQQKSKEAMKKREAAASSKKMSGLARVISDKPPFTRSPGSVDSYSIKSIMPSSILRGKNHKCRPESKIPHKGLSLLGSSPIECSMLKHSKPAVLTRAMSSPSPASSPPLSPSSLAHRPDGGMLIRSNSMDSLVLGGQSPAAGKRKKKGGRKKGGSSKAVPVVAMEDDVLVMPGQEYGRALADVLFGAVSPSAKLPLTMPASEDDLNLTAIMWPGVDTPGGCDGQPHAHCTSAVYSERLLVGYRYYDQHELRPAYAFGHGLTYSSFKLSKLQLTPAPTTTPPHRVVVPWRNPNPRRGGENGDADSQTEAHGRRDRLLGALRRRPVLLDPQD